MYYMWILWLPCQPDIWLMIEQKCKREETVLTLSHLHNIDDRQANKFGYLHVSLCLLSSKLFG